MYDLREIKNTYITEQTLLFNRVKLTQEPQIFKHIFGIRYIALNCCYSTKCYFQYLPNVSKDNVDFKKCADCIFYDYKK